MEGRIWIPKNVEKKEACPCGSEKTYEKCCLKKGLKYRNYGKNHEDKNILIEESECDREYRKITGVVLDTINKADMENGLSVSYGVESLKQLYGLYEDSISIFSKYSSCTKGCSQCCHMYVDLTAMEAEVIRKFVIENFTNEEIEKIMCRLEENKDLVPDYRELVGLEKMSDQLDSYWSKQIPCPFLNEEKECGIYQVRPVKCRTFMAFSKEENCTYEDNKSFRIETPMGNGLLIGADAISTNVKRFKDLKAEDKKTNLLALKKSIYHWFKDGFNNIDRSI
ncbi:YkgJ family cysteine cluster protein [Anaeromicrobium sediminis]|nr:YkgJ family cysteine cluster protein [Anaeromicrobium sediminis]